MKGCFVRLDRRSFTRRVGRRFGGLLIAGLLGGCAGAAATPPASAPTSSVAASGPAGTPTAELSASPSQATYRMAEYDLAYQKADPVLMPGVLDVYAPAGAGPWPVVVMFHGAMGSKSDLLDYAPRVASRGYLVFVPTWGGGVSDWTATTIEASSSQVACAIAFAASRAASYGGDASTLIVFGWSAGAAAAAADVFSRQAPAAGCPGGTSMPPVHALVTWEGDWLFAWLPDWTEKLTADPSIYRGAAIWSRLSLNKTLPVVMLVSEAPGMLDLPLAELPVRDPSGALRKQLEANGALADGVITDTESQQLLYSMLKAQGNPVSLDVMPDSTHAGVTNGGWPVFLAAFDKALGR